MEGEYRIAVCPRCGRKELLLKAVRCYTCNRQACQYCTMEIGQTVPDPYGQSTAFRACGWDCFETAVTYHISRGQSVTPWGGGYVFRGIVLGPEAAWRANKIQAEHLVTAERTEDAALLYEKLGMWKEAGELRRKGRQRVVTQVNVNANDLIDQLRRAGLSANYTCPVCKSPYKISGDTSPDALRSCHYCGSVIPPTDLVEAITKVIGYR